MAELHPLFSATVQGKPPKPSFHALRAAHLAKVFISEPQQSNADYATEQQSLQEYYRRTFVVTVTVRVTDTNAAVNGVVYSAPIVMADDERYGELMRYFEEICGMRVVEELGVEWSHQGVPVMESQTVLTEENTFAVLRMVRQRGGIDNLIVHGEALPAQIPFST